MLAQKWNTQKSNKSGSLYEPVGNKVMETEVKSKTSQHVIFVIMLIFEPSEGINY